MDVRKTLQAGVKGTKRWQAEYGENLLNVRYRYDDEEGVRYTTVELIVEKKPYIHSDINGFIKKPNKITKAQESLTSFVYVKIGYQELTERLQVKAAGGYWDQEKTLWKLEAGKVKDLGFESRVIKCS